MKFSLVLAATTAVSASILPRKWNGGTNLPKSSFPAFQTVTLDEAKAGKDVEIQAPTQGNSSTVNAAMADSISLAATTVKTAAETACSAAPNMRFEWRQYSTSDRAAFVAAVKCLMNKPASGNFPPATSRYEDFVRLHQLYMPNVHNNPKFLVWHRYYLWTFEQVLRSECGFNRAMVWWDETLDAGAFAKSDMFSNSYFGSLPAPDSSGNPVCINNGAFAGLTCNIGPASSNTPHCLSRGVTESNTAQCNAAFMSYCNQRTSYADFESCLEYGPHGYGHNGIGGVMSDVWASPSDPIFWMHHSFIDHGYRIWQNLDSSRVSTINGNDAQGHALTLNTPIYMGGIRPDTTIGAVINTLGGVNIGGTSFCYRYTY